jgi:hypothetical protein
MIRKLIRLRKYVVSECPLVNRSIFKKNILKILSQRNASNVCIVRSVVCTVITLIGKGIACVAVALFYCRF